MAKFYGTIGFEITEETRPGVWVQQIVEKSGYKGDVVSQSYRWQNTSKVNDDVDILVKISVIYDQFAIENLGRIRYVKYLGQNWKVTSVEPEFPRLIMTLGGLYNGNA